MRNKILKSLLLALTSVFAFTACDDDDPNISTTPIIKEVVTTEADVTAYSAELKGTVDGLSGMSSSSFRVGALYSETSDPKSNGTDVSGSYTDGNISASVEGLETNKTYYYCVYVTLQGRVSYYGDVKSFVTTDAKLASSASSSVSASKAVITAAVSGLDGVPVEVGAGAKVSVSSDIEDVKNGLDIAGAISGSTLTVNAAGLLPNTTYYYVPYISLGDGHVYGSLGTFTTGSFTPQYVDLGLSVLWATTNVGAETAADLGSYVGYGQLDPTNHSTDIASYTVTGDVYGGASDIAASLGSGRLPVADEIKELIACTTRTWETVDGVAGIRFTASNGNSVFFPAAGSRYGQDVSDAATIGNYWLGQIDGSNNEFGRSFQFTSASAGLETVARNVAISARSVKKQPKEFKKALLNQTWYIDLSADGKSYLWDGPIYFYGSDDCWTTVSDGDALVGDSWSWCPAWGDISSWIGFEAQEFGTMTFTEDGKVTVVTSDGTTEGTYTVNEQNKTITLTGTSVLHVPGDYKNTSTDLHILSLTEDKLQICIVRSDGQHLSQNYISGEQKSFYSKPNCTVSFCDWDGENSWPTTTQQVSLSPGESHTIAIEQAMVAGRVVILDFKELRSQYPHAFIKLDKIELDGKAVSFDANKLKYGDLEGNGNFRIEIFNCWGAGTASDSPFGGGAKEAETALACNSKIELTYTVVNLKDNQDENLLVAGLTTCDTNWNSTWPDATSILDFNGSVVDAQQSVKVTGSRANGMIYLVELKNVLKTFPNIQLRLDEVLVDGKSVSFNADKILYGELEEKTNNYRIELFNCYGGTGASLPDSNPWASIADGNNIPDLGFSQSFEVKYTVLKLF